MSLLRKIPRIALLGVRWVCGAMVKKLQSQFEVVTLEEVFETAVEVDGALLLPENTLKQIQYLPPGGFRCQPSQAMLS